MRAWKAGVAALVVAALLWAQTRIDLTTQARPVTDDVVLVGNGTRLQALTLPNCSGAATDKLLYSATTNAFSCGTDQSGGTAVGAFALGSVAPSTVAASSTTYYAVPSVTFSPTEANRQWLSPVACTLRDLYVRTSSTQSGTGSMVVTARNNGAATAVTLTIAAGAGAGTFSDTTNTASLAAGDLVSIEFTNNATVASATVYQIVVRCN